MRINQDNIRKICAKKGYKFWANKGIFNLFIGAVRTKNKIPERFDDILFVMYVDNEGKEVTKLFPCTTQPGIYYLNNPLHIAGTAVMIPGQYIGVYSIGLHKNYTALRQVKPIRFNRDNDKDSLAETDNGNLIEEVIYANIHRANATKRSWLVGKWSAACQVLADPDDFDELIRLAKYSAKIYGNSFSYTLIDEEDFKYI